MHTALNLNNKNSFITPQKRNQSGVCSAPRQSATVAVSSSAAVVSAAIPRWPALPVNTTARHKHTCRASKDYFSADDSKQQPPRVRQAGTHTAACSLQLSQAAAIKAPLQHQQIADFRFWHDEKRFRGSGDESLAQHVLFAAGGTRMGGNFKKAKAQGLMGWQVPDRWDVLWSTSDGAMKAAPFIRQGQLISTLPGMDCLTKKRNLAVTLANAYGEAAWQMLPRTYSIPAQLQQFRQRLRDEATAMESAAAAATEGTSTTATAAAAAASTIGPVTGYYVLKTGEHLGQGLKIVPSSKALSALLERNKPYLKPPAQAQNPSCAATDGSSSSSSSSDAGSSSMDDDSSSASSSSTTAPITSSGRSVHSSSGSSRPTVHAAGSQQQQQQAATAGCTLPTSAQAQVQPPRPFICVQQYITNPLLIQGCKFGLRLWVLVLGPKPFRAYLYDEGLVLFSGQQYNADLDAVVTQGAESQGHLTNAAQSRSADVWTLSRLLSSLRPAAADRLQQRLEATAGKVTAAAAPSVQAAAQQLKLPAGGTSAFELLGLDFILDSKLQPWLLEVNASPSLAWDHGQPATAALMRKVKTNMLVAMTALLRLQDRFPPGRAVATPQQQPQQQAEETSSASAALHKRQQQVQQQQQQQQQWSTQQGPYNYPVNPLLLQAASARYFTERPQVLQMVAENAQKLQAAVAAAPCRTDVQQQLQQQQQQGQNISCSTFSHSSSSDASSLWADGQVSENEIELEAERQSAAAGGWKILTQQVT